MVHGWMARHQKYVDAAHKGDIRVLFLGDSIAEGFAYGSRVWHDRLKPLGAASFSIGGDRTENLLWRVENGEVDGLSPRLVVVLIGTNNLDRNTPEEIAAGIGAIVQQVRTRLPGSRILLHGILPRGQDPNDPLRAEIRATNDIIASFADCRTKYRDIGPTFLQPDGSISPEVMPDYLHLSEKGCQIWADAIEPTVLEDLLALP